jgi:hypothetical protein
MTPATKKIIFRVSDLLLEQALRRWKDNSKIYKVMVYKVWLISIFTRPKQAANGKLESWTALCLIYALLFSAPPDEGIVMTHIIKKNFFLFFF